LVKLNICHQDETHFTDMHITSNPHDNFTYSGKLVDERNRPVEGAHVFLTVKYLDSKVPGHPHDLPCLPKNNPSCFPNNQGFSILPRKTTNGDGTFSGSFAACDSFVRPGAGYRSDAQLAAEFQGGTVPSGYYYYLPATSVWGTFTTMPCSGVVPALVHDSKNRISDR
jgi:hypothetical protein